MNTKPDETTLALWLDDELKGTELASVEAWAAGQPDQMKARSDIRRWRATIASEFAAFEEPPYPDFFNLKVLQAIEATNRESRVETKPSSFWKILLAPIAACAAMALTFWAGTQANLAPQYDVAGAPRAIPVEPVVYTPVSGVKAEWFASSKASATVIVLNGVTAIPDSTDFSETVYLPKGREIDFTAGITVEPSVEQDQ